MNRRNLITACLLAGLVASGPVMAEASKPRIVVIGATAKSSKEIIRQAVEAGHEVVAVARRPDEVEPKHPRVRVLKGDVYDRASLEAVTCLSFKII